MTPRFDLWIEQLGQQNTTMVILTAAVLVFELLVFTARIWGGRRAALYVLWAAAVLFWLSLAVLLMVKQQEDVQFHPLLLFQHLWYDEAFTAAVAQLTFDRMLQAVAGDVHPPLWYIVEWGTTRLLGTSEIALRLPALLLGCSAGFLTYQVGMWRASSRQAAWVGAVVLAVMPAQIFYAQEARMYTLLQVAVLVAVLGLLARRWWLFGVGIGAALYTHNLGVLYAAVLGAVALVREFHHLKPVWPPVLALAGAGLAWAPWALLVTLRQVGQVGAGFWLQPGGLGAYLLPVYETTLGIGTPAWLGVHAALVSAGVFVVAVWGCAKAYYDFRNPADYWLWVDWWILPALVVGPPVLAAAVSEVWRPVYLARAFLPCLPFLAILFAEGMARLRSYARPVLGVLVPLIVLIFAVQAKSTTDTARWYADIAARYQPGDVIYHGNLASYISMSYYLPASDGYRHAVWPDAGDLSQALTVQTQHAMGIPRADAPDIDAQRLWVVWIENPMTTLDEVDAIRAALLTGEAHRVTTWQDSELVRATLWEVVR